MANVGPGDGNAELNPDDDVVDDILMVSGIRLWTGCIGSGEQLRHVPHNPRGRTCLMGGSQDWSIHRHFGTRTRGTRLELVFHR